MDVIGASVPGGRLAVELTRPGAGHPAAIMSQAAARAAAGPIVGALR